MLLLHAYCEPFCLLLSNIVEQVFQKFYIVPVGILYVHIRHDGCEGLQADQQYPGRRGLAKGQY